MVIVFQPARAAKAARRLETKKRRNTVSRPDRARGRPRRMKAIRLAFAAVLAGIAAGALAVTTLSATGCDSGVGPLLCGEIPANGCPVGRGGSCDDGACAGLYDCVSGKWTLTTDCSADGGTSGSSGSSGSSGGDSGADAACTPVVISHAGEMLGCKPDLQAPDCPVSLADGACMENVCAVTDCAEFYLCIYDKDQVDHRSWAAVAACDEDGTLVVAP
jgi:hypothetical protein